MHLPRAWQPVLGTAEVRSRAEGATHGLQPLCRWRGASRPSPRVCHRFGSLGPPRGQEKPTFWRRQGTVPWVQEERSSGEAGGVAARRATEASAPGNRDGHVLRENVSGRLGLGKVRLRDSEELMGEIQLPVI